MKKIWKILLIVLVVLLGIVSWKWSYIENMYSHSMHTREREPLWCGPGYITNVIDCRCTGDWSPITSEGKYICEEIVIATTTLINNSTTYLYKNHGFTIELPRGYISQEQQSEGGPSISISLPVGNLSYVSDSLFWEKNVIPSYIYIKDEKIGQTFFKIYTYSGTNIYWFKQGKVGYEFGGTDKINLEKILETFKFIGWQ